MKRFFAILLSMLLLLPVFGCGSVFELHKAFDPETDSTGSKKVFSGNGYTIALTDAFTERKSQVGFDGYYTSPFCGVMVQIVTPQKAAERNITSIKRLLDQTIADNGSDRGSEVTEENGLTYYHYTRGTNAGWNFAFKGSENYYLVQFVCAESDSNALKDMIFGFARSVTVE